MGSMIWLGLPLYFANQLTGANPDIDGLVARTSRDKHNRRMQTHHLLDAVP
jgi:hypothetical protein